MFLLYFVWHTDLYNFLKKGEDVYLYELFLEYICHLFATMLTLYISPIENRLEVKIVLKEIECTFLSTPLLYNIV